MNALLRVLLINDDEEDTQSILHELQRAGYWVDYQCVDTRAAMEQALFHEVWDIVLCNYNHKQLSIMDVLATFQVSPIRIPFFLRSWTIGNETEVMVLELRANDFVIQEGPSQLLLALEQELAEI